MDINQPSTIMKRRTIQLIASALCALCIGGLIYAIWRPECMRMSRWASQIGLGAVLISVRTLNAPLMHHIPPWVVFSLPDGLYSYSATTALGTVWWSRGGRTRLFWMGLVPSLAILLEIGQLSHRYPGSFGFVDIGSYLLGALLGSCQCGLTLRNRRRR